jgi:heavy metal translocating P-type ATPase
MSAHEHHAQLIQEINTPPEQEQAQTRRKTPQSQVHALWPFLKRYYLPLGTLLLLATSLTCWLLKRTDLATDVLLGAVLFGGIPLLWRTFRRFLHREFSVDLIALLAIAGSLWLREYLAGAFIVLMLSGGEALEAYALRRARVSLSSLAERAPRIAHIWQGERLVNVAAEEVTVGMTVVVKPGELVPVDGVVEQGESNVSEADITGEAVPVRKAPGTPILSGSVNLDSVLEVRATRASAESQYARIIQLVQQAQEQKAPIHRLADRYSLFFTALTVLVAGGAWFLSGDSVYALAVLVVATPCPLILATPIAIMSGIDRAAHYGIIVKSGATIEQLGEVDIAVFDKTGTLTLGTPEVVGIELGAPVEEAERRIKENELLTYAASVEQLSTHILARAVVEAARARDLALRPARDFEETFGKGVHGRVPRLPAQNGEAQDEAMIDVAIGNRTYMHYLEIAVPASLRAERERRTAQGQICSYIALERQVVGLIILEDVPRAELSELTRALKQEGIQQTVLLTGDSEVVAQQIGAVARVDRIVARCLPEDKVRTIQELERGQHRVLMVGDGVNDAPALATAAVGMALGMQGLTAAASAADAVLISPDIMRVVTAVRVGRRVMQIARQGIWIGMGLSIVAMLFAASGYIPPAAGAILQEGIDVLVILNALRVSRSV